jgi:ribosomal-protein-alanine N-acetyltransferase
MTEPIDYRHVSILWATPEHAAELASLHAPLFKQPWNEDAFARLLGHPAATAFLARVGVPARSAGFILGQVAADEAEIITLGVCAQHQRHGIGRRLVEALARAARRAEARTLFLEVGAGNTAAVGLYRRLGFKEVGRRTGYYADGAAPEDALRLALAL